MKVLVGVSLITLLLAAPVRAAGFYVTVAGLVGEPDYEQRFTTSAKDLDKILKASGSDVHVFSLIGGDATRARLTQVLEQVAREAKADDDFVLTLIGHGSHDGVEYKFNLVGPDMSAPELAALCNRIAARRQLVVNATSASGGSIPAFQRAGRAVITSTKSGTEKNATVFVRYWVAALQDPSADVDKNESVSALEAFQGEAVRAASAEGGEGRLLASLTLVRFGESQKAALDPAKRDLLTKREDLERRIDVLKYQKAAMSQTDYEQQLKALLIELARVQATLDK
jgi:hypothetical protein